jgi:hypothetical protein
VTASAAQAAAARQALMASLAGLFTALQDPGFARQLGPAVQGGSLPGGARVPGTSFELEPAAVAQRLAALLGDAAGILAHADFSARRAVLEGRTPPSMREVFEALQSAPGTVDRHEGELAVPPSELAARYHASVAALYPPKQQARVQGLFADPEALDAMPVQVFMAALVRNG